MPELVEVSPAYGFSVECRELERRPSSPVINEDRAEDGPPLAPELVPDRPPHLEASS